MAWIRNKTLTIAVLGLLTRIRVSYYTLQNLTCLDRNFHFLANTFLATHGVFVGLICFEIRMVSKIKKDLPV